MDLQLFWYVLLGILLAGYAVLDGFDLGVGVLHLFVRGDDERRILLNAIGPVWDGNEVWLVVFGGALFAAFPDAYATGFSALYLPFTVLLVCLIFRAVAIEFRSKRPGALWRAVWDWAFALASTATAFLMGAAIGNLVVGMPIVDGRYTGPPLGAVHPYSILTGAFAVALFAMHGGAYLLAKTEGELLKRVQRLVWTACGLFFTLYMVTTIFTLVRVDAARATLLAPGPLWAVVVVNVVAAANVPRAAYLKRPMLAFGSTALTIVCLVVLLGAATFPNLIASSVAPEHSLTFRNSASSEATLALMRTIAFIGMPFVLAYTAVVYWVFRGRVRLTKNSY